MIKLTLLLTLTSLLSFHAPAGSSLNKAKAEYVYICDSNTAYAYHKTKDCSGLNRCTHEIRKITKADAINEYGRRACKVCY
ncbi:MAG TPA: hypothetical protein VFW07_27080 [Parafilimonas sp.]|nr:hypothetical protein [Parafilimonas sp.]